MNPNTRLPPRSSGTSDGPSYRLPSISNLVHVVSEPLDPPRQPPEPTLPRHPSQSQQRHVKQEPGLVLKTSPQDYHNLDFAATGAEFPYARPASPLEQFQLRGRGNHRSREMQPPRGLGPPPTQRSLLPPARHTTTGTFAGPSAFHISAPASHSSGSAGMWSRHSYGVRSAQVSHPSHQNQPPISTPHPSSKSSDGPSQMLPSFASTFGQTSAPQAQASRVAESKQAAPRITVARSRESESSRPTVSYPPDSRREHPKVQTDANPSANTVGTHALPIHRLASSNYILHPIIQIGLRQDYEFRPVERPGRPAFSSPAPSKQPERNVALNQQSSLGHHTADAQERVMSGGQSNRPPSPTGDPPVSLPRSTATVASSHAHGYPVGNRPVDSNGPRVPVVSHSLSNPPSSVPASSSPSLHAPPTLPTQPKSRPVPSRPRPSKAPKPSAQETPGLDSVSSRRPSQGRGARGRQQGPRRVRSDLASDTTRAPSRPRKRPRRKMDKAFDPTPIFQMPPMITIASSQSLQAQTQTGTDGVPPPTPGSLLAVGTIPPRPKRLILQTGPEDLPRVQALLTQESQTAAARNKHIKKINEYSKILGDFAGYYAKYKAMNVPQPSQSEIAELAHRLLCIVELCKDSMFRAKRAHAVRAGRDPDKEIASANARLSVLPTLRQALPATAASNREVNVRGTGGDPPNPLKRGHDSMVSGTAAPPVKSEQEIDMELIRNKRMAAQSGVKGKYTKRNKRAAPPQKCTSCGTRETPEWRRGPDGQRSLCNACGLHYAKLIKNQKGIWIGEGDPPPIDVLTLRQVTKIGVQPAFNDKGELVIPGFYRVPASQAQSRFIRDPSITLPIAAAGGGGVDTSGGGGTESSAASAVPATGPNQACGPSASEAPLDGLEVAVDEDEDLTMPAGKRRRWKAAPPDIIANATRATSASASSQLALLPQPQTSSIEPEQTP